MPNDNDQHEAKAAEDARRAAEAQAEDARRAAEAKAAEDARRAAEAQAADGAAQAAASRIAVDQVQRLTLAALEPMEAMTQKPADLAGAAGDHDRLRPQGARPHHPGTLLATADEVIP